YLCHCSSEAKIVFTLSTPDHVRHAAVVEDAEEVSPMGERRVLIIGSQCQQMPPLSFLPGVAHELYAVLTASDLGGCVSALPGQDGLLINPTVKQTYTAIETAFQRASADEATLCLAFIGHGEYVTDDFYLLPWDAQVPPGSRTAIHLVQLITELH